MAASRAPQPPLPRRGQPLSAAHKARLTHLPKRRRGDAPPYHPRRSRQSFSDCASGGRQGRTAHLERCSFIQQTSPGLPRSLAPQVLMQRQLIPCTVRCRLQLILRPERRFCYSAERTAEAAGRRVRRAAADRV